MVEEEDTEEASASGSWSRSCCWSGVCDCGDVSEANEVELEEGECRAAG